MNWCLSVTGGENTRTHGALRSSVSPTRETLPDGKESLSQPKRTIIHCPRRCKVKRVYEQIQSKRTEACPIPQSRKSWRVQGTSCKPALSVSTVALFALLGNGKIEKGFKEQTLKTKNQGSCGVLEQRLVFGFGLVWFKANFKPTGIKKAYLVGCFEREPGYQVFDHHHRSPCPAGSVHGTH